ncbi:MAG TPA: PAS domain S-box protein [Deltaproteobacteria bacterium]|nr:PAS domain S-box protein [Deltaproteobacteria bacterium]HPR55981.1 PAS domain S-box protein [Deltaproteobacteria bacterium]HXK46577.1 PAS domain S-box protein [Deltaproteobacteria bacterium]
MKLTGRMSIILISLMVVLAIGLYGIFRVFVIQSFLDLDNKLAERNLERSLAAFERDIKHLDNFVHDWSSWDDTYRFAMDGNRAFIAANLVHQVFQDQRLNLIHIYDTKGNLVWGRTYGESIEEEIPLDLKTELSPDTFRRVVLQKTPGRSTSGVVNTRYGVLVLSSNPILTSENKGPSHGSMVMGRFFTREWTETLSEQVNIHLESLSVLDRNMDGEARSFLQSGSLKRLADASPTVKHAYAMVPDIMGRPVFIMKATITREVMEKGRWATTMGFLSMIGLGLIFLAVESILLGVMVLKPIRELTRHVLHFGNSPETAEYHPTDRKDEIGILSREFGTMVERLSHRQRSLEMEERRLRQIIDMVPHYIYARDGNGRFVLANKATADLLGTTVQDLIGRMDSTFDRSADMSGKSVQESLDPVSGCTSVQVIQEELHDAQGRKRFVQTTVIPFIFSDMSGPAMLGVSVDITDIKLAEEKIHQSQRMMANLIDFLPDATFAVDRNGKLIAWNRTMEHISGIPKEKILGKGHREYARIFYKEARPLLLDLVFEDNREISSRYDLIMREGDKIICESFAPALHGGKGAHVWAIAAPFYDKDGNIMGAIECVRDITEKKQAEEFIRRHSETIEQLLDGVCMVGLDGTVHYVNRAWAEMHGYTHEEIKGKTMDLFHSENQMMNEVIPFMEEVRKNGNGRGKLLHMKKNGTTFPALASSFLLKNDKGDPYLYVVIARDITEELKMENQLRQAQKMEVVGRLAGGVAHDLNNMLSPILGYSEIVLADLPENDPNYDSIMQVKTAADRARNLTHELLAFSRKQVLDMKVVDLAAVVASYGKMLRRTIREDISIQIRQSITKGAVRVDTGQVGQILMNLAVNAADAMPNGGIITIEINDAALDESYARIHHGVVPGDYVVMSFSDTGTGIDNMIMEHIFEPFFTTKDRGKGTGLGLATVYGIIRQHGGHVSVYSEPGLGTTFKLYLPSVEGTVECIPESAKITLGQRGNETVVVAEDDRSVRDMTCDILKKHGYRVITADDVDKLLRTIHEHEGNIDLLLTDVIMPATNGRELYEKLKEDRPSLKVLYMSGYTNDVIAHHGILEQGVMFIQKPFSLGALTDKVRSVLDG